MFIFYIFFKVLSDSKKRQQYDAYGTADNSAGGGGGPGGFGGGGYQYQSSVDPEELFRTIFGDAFKQRGGSNYENMFSGFGNQQQEPQFNEVTQVNYRLLPILFDLGTYLICFIHFSSENSRLEF